MRSLLPRLLIAFGLLLVTTSHVMAADSKTRARALYQQIRCEVCDGQDISSSNAGLAQDMRAMVDQQIAEGKSDEQILQFFTSRYGDAILMRPPIKPATWGLWLGPLFVALLGGFFLIRYFRRGKVL